MKDLKLEDLFYEQTKENYSEEQFYEIMLFAKMLTDKTVDMCLENANRNNYVWHTYDEEVVARGSILRAKQFIILPDGCK